MCGLVCGRTTSTTGEVSNTGRLRSFNLVDILAWYTLLYILGEWVIRIMMVPVVLRRRSPNAAMSWLLVIFFIPWVGLFFYLLIGENRLPNRRIRHHRRILKELQSVTHLVADHPQVFRPVLAPGFEKVVELAERLGNLPILGGNCVEMMVDTTESIDRLIADIDEAQHHVHMLFYIFGDDATGNRVADALIRATARGVTCRVLVDTVGSWSMLSHLAPLMRESGVQVHGALPVKFFRRKAARLDLRNHRKLAVIDGSVVYSGSQNIVDASYGRKDLAWHDLMLRMTGPIAVELQLVFLEDWYAETQEKLETTGIFPQIQVTGNIPVQTLPSGPSYPTENYQRLVVAALHAAEERVVITTPYFVPDEALLQAMQVAVLRGVLVEVLVPERSDQIIVGAAGRAYYQDLLDAGVHVYLYQPGLLHSKTVTFDDGLALIGSSNFDIRSFTLNFELNLLFYGSETTGRLREIQSQYLADSRQLTAAEWKKRSTVRRLAEHTARLFSPLL